MGYKEKQEICKPEILRLLSIQQYGMIISKIKEDLNESISRNTIQNYLDQLAEEGKVRSLKIGRYELWFHKNTFENIISNNLATDHPSLNFIRYFLEELEQNPAIKSIDWKQFGINLEKNFKFYPYFPSIIMERGKHMMVEEPEKMILLFEELYPPILKKVLNFLGDVESEIDPPIIQESPCTYIYRVRNSRFSKSQIFFPMLCGLEEAEISSFLPLPLKVDVLQQFPDKNLVDLSYTFSLPKD